jgi:glycosyltransferase involved in cell wall biosynthesis
MTQVYPRVSLGLPVYNGEHFLKDAIDSILNQTYEDFELIVCDNASTDKTEEICKEYASRDCRIHYYRNDINIGAARNFNRVFQLSKGEYFKWVAHDDICSSSFLAECIDILDKDNSVVLCYTKTQLINSSGNPIGISYKSLLNVNDLSPHKRFRDILLHAVWCFEVFGLIRACNLRKTSLIGKYFGSDKVLLAELSLLGRFHEVDRYLFQRRCYAGQSTKMTVSEKAAWIDSLSKKILPHQAEALAGYLSAAWKTPLTMSQRIQCYLSIARLVFKLDKWKKLLLPSLDNYFGIDLQRISLKRNSQRLQKQRK